MGGLVASPPMQEPAEEPSEPTSAAPKTAARGAPAWSALGADLRVVLLPWLTARLLVGMAWVLSVTVVDRLRDQHVLSVRPDQLGNGLVAWDGTWYRDLAIHGYRSEPLQAVRFFPLFPLIGRVLAVPIGGRVDIPLVIVANLCSLVVGVLVLRLVRLERGDEALAARSVWILMLFPAAFVLVLAYAESLMMVMTVGAFLALRRGRWWWAVPFGFLAALSRPLGVLVAVPAAVELLRAWPRMPNRDRAGALAAVVAPVAGLVAFLGWVQRVYGDWKLPFSVQDNLRGRLVLPPARIVEGFHQMLGSQRASHGLHIPFLLVFVVLVVLTFRYWPSSYGAYAAAMVLLAMSAQNLNSLERYGMSAFPLALTIAVLASSRTVERMVVAVLGGGLVALSSMAWLGAYVP